MSLCETISDKIISFERLTPEEQREVVAHAETCTACRKRLQIYQIVALTAPAEKGHPLVRDLLTRYCSYLADPGEPDYDGRTLTAAEVETISSHLTECQSCQEELRSLQAEFLEITDYLEGTELAMAPSVAASRKQSLAELTSQYFISVAEAVKEATQAIADKVAAPLPKYYPVAIAAAAALMIAVWVAPNLTRTGNPYLSLSSLEGEKLSFTTRGAGAGDLNNGLSDFEAGNYASAITKFGVALQHTTDTQDLFYAHFLLGISYLKEAKHDVLGFFPGVDTDAVQQAIRHLSAARGLTENPGQQEACQWYTAKAYLALGDREQATRLLREIIQLRGRRYGAARKLLQQLDELPATDSE